MANTAKAIVVAVKAALVAVDGTGIFTLDLSAADQVKRGNYSKPPRHDLATVCFWVEEAPVDDDAVLGHYSTTLILGIKGWIGATDGDVETREDACLDLVHDVRLGIEVDRGLGVTTVRDVHIDLEFLHGTSDHQPATQPVGFEGSIRVDYAKDTGL